MNIHIVAIPHAEQRYATVGDWYDTEDGLVVRVSDTGDWRYNFLIGLHEIVEAMACKAHGVKEEEVTAFDVAYEEKRQEGDDSEPGDSADACYYREHIFAARIEAMMAEELGVDWESYGEAVAALP